MELLIKMIYPRQLVHHQIKADKTMQEKQILLATVILAINKSALVNGNEYLQDV